MDATGEAGRSDLCQRVIKPPLREAGDPIHHGNNETKMNSSILTPLNNGGRLTSPPAAQLARSCILSALVRHPPPHTRHTHTHTTPSRHPPPSCSNFLQKSDASATLFSISPFQGKSAPLPQPGEQMDATSAKPAPKLSFFLFIYFFFFIPAACKSRRRSFARCHFVYYA